MAKVKKTKDSNESVAVKTRKKATTAPKAEKKETTVVEKTTVIENTVVETTPKVEKTRVIINEEKPTPKVEKKEIKHELFHKHANKGFDYTWNGMEYDF